MGWREDLAADGITYINCGDAEEPTPESAQAVIAEMVGNMVRQSPGVAAALRNLYGTGVARPEPAVALGPDGMNKEE